MTVEEIKQRATPVFQEYGVLHAAIFGSFARGEGTPESDVDLLVRLGRPTGMVGYMRLVESLEQSLGRKVDLVTEQSLNPRIKSFVHRELVNIFE